MLKSSQIISRQTCKPTYHLILLLLGSHVLYWSFDTLSNFSVMEGTELLENFDPRVPGQVVTDLVIYLTPFIQTKVLESLEYVNSCEKFKGLPVRDTPDVSRCLPLYLLTFSTM